MSADAELRRAERSGDRAELVRAMVRAGLGREAVARCGLHVGDVVRRAREPWPERDKEPCASSGSLLRITKAHAFTFRDPDASRGVRTVWLEGGDPDAWWAKGCEGPRVLARTLDLVEPGDGEQVLQPVGSGLQSATTQVVAP